MTAYNLEYRVMDKLNRPQKSKHYGVYASLEDAREAMDEVSRMLNNERVSFEIFTIENLFTKVSQS